MDSQSRAFETSHESVSGTPLPCHRRMKAQELESWTAATVAGSLASLLLAVPRALALAPAVIRRRA